MRRYLIDENLSPQYPTQLRKHEPSLKVLRVGDEGAPASGSKDPDILKWCEQNNYTLVTEDKKTMRSHLDNHLSKGRHVPGIFTISTGIKWGTILDQLILIAGASFEDEYMDDITFIPL